MSRRKVPVPVLGSHNANAFKEGAVNITLTPTERKRDEPSQVFQARPLVCVWETTTALNSGPQPVTAKC